MKVIRCCKCGEDLEIENRENMSCYSEDVSDLPCFACRSQPIKSEERLLQAIFGESDE